jgi:phosphoadenosine phosphosulfate reductase
MADWKLTFQQANEDDFARVNGELVGRDALDVLRWAYAEYGDGLVYACSFGAEGMVLLDLISRVKPQAEVLFLDTHLHFPETYQLIEQTGNRYPELQIKLLQPELTLAEQAALHGEELWKRDPDACCRIRKIEPLRRQLAGKTAWLSGLRREQSPTRAHLNYVNPDPQFSLVKICPLIHWSLQDVWMYIKLYELPYNPLHDRRYPSIGCMPCTRPVNPGEDERAGRWAGRNKSECGLHQPNK